MTPAFQRHNVGRVDPAMSCDGQAPIGTDMVSPSKAKLCLLWRPPIGTERAKVQVQINHGLGGRAMKSLVAACILTGAFFPIENAFAADDFNTQFNCAVTSQGPDTAIIQADGSIGSNRPLHCIYLCKLANAQNVCGKREIKPNGTFTCRYTVKGKDVQLIDKVMVCNHIEDGPTDLCQISVEPDICIPP